MTYIDEWKAISSRIRGLLQAGELHARFLSINSSDTYNRSARLREQCENVLATLESYANNHKNHVPNGIVESINGFSSKYGQLIRDSTGTRDSQDQRIWAALVLYGSLESEISFLLADTQQAIRTISERAFAHLQRSIVADSDIREKWRKAFQSGEVACEQLGGVHLLSHGIFGFKIDAQGERTDLVLQESLRDLNDLERLSDGLVLTEWKKAGSDAKTEKHFIQAKKQAHLYAKGALAATELRSFRYLVVVSLRRFTPPADITENGVTYRHINIAVDPQSPSKSK